MSSSDVTCDDDDRPCTPDELMAIISAPSGGVFMLPNDPYDEVYDNIYVGEDSIAKSPVGLRNLGITHLVNVAEGAADNVHVNVNPRLYAAVGVHYMGIQADDYMNFDLAQYFGTCADHIEEALAKGGKVMVNCKVGGSRSATIVIAYMMLKRRVPVQEAVRTLRNRREICPNDGFLQQLCDLNTALKAEGHYNAMPTQAEAV